MEIIVKEVKLTDQEAADILTTAIESNGIQYWACLYDKINIWRSDKLDGSIIKAVFKTDKEEGNGTPITYTVDLKSVRRGVNLLFDPKTNVSKDILKSVIDDDIDSEGADCIIQLACFGEIIYG